VYVVKINEENIKVAVYVVKINEENIKVAITTTVLHRA